jgi:hypothetical protein
MVLDAKYREALGVPQDSDLKSFFQAPIRKRRSIRTSSAVTVTRRDGSIEVVAPLSARELRMLVREREPISNTLRARVLRRDRGLCRYCGSSGPHHLDHVLPVALGGRSTMRNLVLACVECNLRKGAAVWRPKPVGFFLSG